MKLCVFENKYEDYTRKCESHMFPHIETLWVQVKTYSSE